MKLVFCLIHNDIIINDSIVGLSSFSNFYVSRNWINNNNFIPGLSTVTLNGSFQEITGTENTDFFNLNTNGNLVDKKSLIGVNAFVFNNLNIGDVELATNNNKLSILNPNTNSIIRNSGFVSSLDTGQLERATNSTDSYLFPTGSTDVITRYRPLEITPNSTSSNKFGARLANVEASIEGFDVLNLSDTLCSVNPDFYHRIYAESGSADITMNYIASIDGDWANMGNWKSSNLWDKTRNETIGNNFNFSTITTLNVNDFSEPSFILALEKPKLLLDDQVFINNGASITINPTYTGITPNNITWSPIENNSCPNCLETELNPIITTDYLIEVNVTETCSINDSIRVNVKPAGLQLPTAFTPNLDGVNDYFVPLNKNIEEYEINIFNRWGELIFKSNDLNTGWNGIYKGKIVPLGVYTYSAEYKNIGYNKRESQTGNITIIR